MAEKTFIFGAGALARVLFYYLDQAGQTPRGFVVDDAWCTDESFCGLPQVPFSRIAEHFPPAEYSVYVAVGYGKMNAARKDAFLRLRALGYQTPNFIHSSVLNASIAIGKGNLVFPGVILDAFTEIGDCNVFYPSVMIAHDSRIGSFNFFAPRAALAGDIVVRDRCFFGLNCSVKNGITIADRCLLGAGVFAATDLTEGSVLVPARSVLLNADSDDMIQKVMKK